MNVHDLALLADGHAAALVHRDGTIVWCCLPRFDHGSCFAALLDPDRGGSCAVAGPGGPFKPIGARYLDGTLVHEATLEAPGGRVRVLDALVPGGGPRRLVCVVEGVAGRVDVVLRVEPRFDYGAVRPWVRMRDDGRATLLGGDDALVLCTDGALERRGDHDLRATATVREGERLRLTLTWMAPERAGEPCDGEDADGELDRTTAWWRDWCEDLEGEAARDAAARRSALVLRSLVYDPTGAIVAAPTTSLPESAEGTRTWDYRYAWIRDATFACRALAGLGKNHVADAFAAFVMRASAGNAQDLQVLYGVRGERRMPEQQLDLAGFNGARPVRLGNGAASQIQRDEPGEILRQAVHRQERGHVFDDDEWRFVLSLVEHVIANWRDPDRGFWEWRGDPEHFVYSKAACRSALECGLRLAEGQRREVDAQRWIAERDAIAALIHERGFDERRGTFVQVLDRPEMDATVLLLPHTGVVDWDDERMVSTAEAVREHLGEDGLIRRCDRDDGLPGREGCFLACSFWLAECLARQGRLAQARDAYDRAMETASPLGLFSEEYDPRAGLPLGNYPQALTHLAQLTAAAALAEVRA